MSQHPPDIALPHSAPRRRGAADSGQGGRPVRAPGNIHDSTKNRQDSCMKDHRSKPASPVLAVLGVCAALGAQAARAEDAK